MKKNNGIKNVVIALVLFSIAFITLLNAPIDTPEQSNVSTTTSQFSSTTSNDTTQSTIADPVASQPTETIGQKNALKSAINYVKIMGFSKAGLKKQLEYEGYAIDDCNYAVESCGADWNAQAVRCAENYLKTMSFSKSELITQLEFEGFTPEQAQHGVIGAGY